LYPPDFLDQRSLGFEILISVFLNCYEEWGKSIPREHDDITNPEIAE